MNYSDDRTLSLGSTPIGQLSHSNARARSYHVISFGQSLVVIYKGKLSCRVVLCRVMSFYVTSCHAMSCHVVSRHVTSCHVIPCHVTWRFFMSILVVFRPSCQTYWRRLILETWSTVAWNQPGNRTFPGNCVCFWLFENYLCGRRLKDSRIANDAIYMSVLQLMINKD